MNFDLTDEQLLLRQSVAGHLARHYSFEDRQATRHAGGWSSAAWQSFAGELGLFGAAFPESAGGYGGGPIEIMLIMEEFGRALVLEPYLEAVVLAGRLIEASADTARLAPLISGEELFVPALYEASGRYNLAAVETRAARRSGGWTLDGGKAVVTGGPVADRLLVSARTVGAARDRDGIGLFLVDHEAAGLERRDYTLIDGRPASDLTFAATPATLLGPPDAALPAIEHAVDAAIAGLCAEALGVMRVLLASTVDYTRSRKQFGQPIAAFQVIQHRMADMLTLVERTESIAVMAALSLGLPGPQRRRALSGAKAFTANAVRTVAQSAVQIHGGIGTTDELPLSHYFRRATVIESQFGSAAHHLARVADALDAGG